MEPEILSHRTFNGKRYKLISKTGKKTWANEEARKWRAKGYLARIVKVATKDWKYAIYITKG